MLKRILTAPFVLLLGLWMGFVEWLWQPLQRQIKKLTRWRFFRALERGVGRLPPYAALALFLVPMITLIPLKLVGVYLLAHGKRLLGLLVFVIGKVIGTAMAAWVYSLTEPALNRLPWFVRLRDWFLKFKAGIYERIRTSTSYRFTRRKVHSLRASLKNLFA